MCHDGHCDDDTASLEARCVTRVLEDQRPMTVKPEPPNKLKVVEVEQILSVCNEPTYSHVPPSQIVPRLADTGVYIASESSFYRVLKAHKQLTHRGRAKRAQSRPPSTYQATKPNEVWMWDITYRVPGAQGKHGCLNEPRVYLKYIEVAA